MNRVLIILIRLGLVAIVSVAMALLGVWLLAQDPTMIWTSHGYAYVAGVSVLLWIALSFLLARCNIVQTITVGLLSPAIGGMLVCPVGAHVYLLGHWYVTFPIGVTTAFLVRLAIFMTGGLRSQVRRRRGLCPKCAYPVGASPVCTECGTPIPGGPPTRRD